VLEPSDKFIFDKNLSSQIFDKLCVESILKPSLIRKRTSSWANQKLKTHLFTERIRIPTQWNVKLNEDLYDKKLTPNKNKNLTLKGRDYYVRVFRTDYVCYVLVHYNNHIITLTEFIKRLRADLNGLIKDKDFIKSFCSHLKREIRIELQSYMVSPKLKKTKRKTITPLYKGNTKFSIGFGTGYMGLKGSIGIESGFVENMIFGIKNCRIVAKESIRNLVKLRDIFPYFEVNHRIHEYRWVFSSLDVEILDVLKYLVKNGNIKGSNLSVWITHTTKSRTAKPRATSLIVSISCRAVKHLYGLELWNEGFREIYERLPSDLALMLALKLYTSQYNMEIAFKPKDMSKNREVYQELGFRFSPKVYKIYNVRYWLDSSFKGIELEFSLKTNYNAMFSAIKLIESLLNYLSFYEKGIEIIEPFSLETIENKGTKNNFSKKAKRCYKVVVFLKRVKSFATRVILKKSKS